MSATSELTVHLALTSSPSSPRIPLKIPKDVPAGKLRSSAAEATKIPLSSIKLIFRGRLIAESDKDAVAEFKLEDGCVVHCMGKPASDAAGASVEAAGSATTAAPVSAAPAGASVTIPAAATAASPTAPATASSSTEDPLSAALAKMKSEISPPSAYLTALQTLEKILSNIESHPMEEKYRRVKRGNAAFQRRLGGLPGGHDAMMASGFSVEREGEGEEVYKIIPSPEAWPKLVQAKGRVGAALNEARRASTMVPPPAQPGASAAPTMPGMGGMGGLPPMMPGMEEAASAMLSNPDSLQRMLQDPMVRNMMRNDPRFANNPQMVAQMEALMSDPNMVRQMSQMMSDPAMREQMMQMSRAGMGGMGGSGFGGMGGASPGAAPPGQQPPTMDPAAMATQMRMLQQMMGQQAQQGQPAGGSALGGQPGQGQQGNAGGGSNGNGGGSGGGNDQDMTEEEMIQEAIRRSLQDGSS